jgi:hypothetical protein
VLPQAIVDKWGGLAERIRSQSDQSSERFRSAWIRTADRLLPALQDPTLTVWLPTSCLQAAIITSGTIGHAKSSLTVQRRSVSPAAIAGVRCR